MWHLNWIKSDHENQQKLKNTSFMVINNLHNETICHAKESVAK